MRCGEGCGAGQAHPAGFLHNRPSTGWPRAMAMALEEALRSAWRHIPGEKISSSGMGFAACGEQDVEIGLVSAALPGDGGGSLPEALGP